MLYVMMYGLRHVMMCVLVYRMHYAMSVCNAVRDDVWHVVLHDVVILSLDAVWIGLVNALIHVVWHVLVND